MTWLEKVNAQAFHISEHDQLDSARKVLLKGNDDQFESRSDFYLRMSGQISFMNSFSQAMEAFLAGQVDMIVSSVTALDAQEIEAVEKIIMTPNKPFSVRSATFGRIIIDNGCLEF